MAEFSSKAQDQSGAGTIASSSAEGRRAAAEASAAFALALYGELADDAGNLFFAPASITAVLTMAWVGSQGETATELERALRLPQDPEALRATLLALSSQASAAVGCELSIANALWVEERCPLLSEYLEFVRGSFSAAVEQADFARAAEETRREINDWVVTQTKGHIQDLIPPGTLSALTRLVLVNAVYFKGAWAAKFAPWRTEPLPFYRLGKAPLEVPLMYRTGLYRLLERPDFQALELPYEGNALAMVVLLPRAPDGLRDLGRKLDAAQLHAIFEQLERQKVERVEVYLPRFHLEASFRLDAALQQLGARRAFEMGADFSSMTADPEGLFIGAVLHKAFVDVGEEGTVATAATALAAPTGSAPSPPPPVTVFRANHPFLFAIRDARSGAVLFLGRLADPSA